MRGLGFYRLLEPEHMWIEVVKRWKVGDDRMLTFFKVTNKGKRVGKERYVTDDAAELSRGFLKASGLSVME